MTDTIIPILETLIPVVAGVLFTLVGIIYKRLIGRIEDIEENVGDLEQNLLEVNRDMDIAHTWMFGRDDDPANSGIAADIKEINDNLDQLVDELHDEEDLEFERDYLEE